MKTHKEKIDELITLKKKNNLINHISTSLFNKGETIADKNSEEYIIWTRNYWISTFYPIFRIRFNEENQIKSIKIELSLYAKLWAVIMTSLILSFFLFALVIPIIQSIEYFDYTDLIILSIYVSLVYGIYWVLKRMYKNETKYLMNDLKVAVGIDTKENIERIENEKKEWSLRMVITRIIFYPFSIIILIFIVHSMIHGSSLNGKAYMGIIVVIAYLYADIKILRKKGENN